MLILADRLPTARNAGQINTESNNNGENTKTVSIKPKHKEQIPLMMKASLRFEYY